VSLKLIQFFLGFLIVVQCTFASPLSEERQRVKRQTGTLQETFQQLQNLQQQQSQQNAQRPQGSSPSGSSFGPQNTGGGSNNQDGGSQPRPSSAGSQQRPSSGTSNQGSNQFNRPSSQSGNSFNWSNGNQQGGSQPATTVRSPLNVVSSELTVPEAPCIRNCMAVSTYDPVCGSDDITYTNRAKFRCAQQCGRSK